MDSSEWSPGAEEARRERGQSATQTLKRGALTQSASGSPHPQESRPSRDDLLEAIRELSKRFSEGDVHIVANLLITITNGDLSKAINSAKAMWPAKP